MQQLEGVEKPAHLRIAVDAAIAGACCSDAAARQAGADHGEGLIRVKGAGSSKKEIPPADGLPGGERRSWTGGERRKRLINVAWRE